MGHLLSRLDLRQAGRGRTFLGDLCVVHLAFRPDARAMPAMIVIAAGDHLEVLVDRHALLLRRELVTAGEEVVEALSHAPAHEMRLREPTAQAGQAQAAQGVAGERCCKSHSSAKEERS